MQDDKSFVQPPIRVLMDNRLTSGQKLLYASLMSFDFADKDGKRKGIVYPSIHKLHERSGLSDVVFEPTHRYDIILFDLDQAAR